MLDPVPSTHIGPDAAQGVGASERSDAERQCRQHAAARRHVVVVSPGGVGEHGVDVATHRIARREILDIVDEQVQFARR